MGDAQVKFTLGERDIPTHWVNLMADLPGDAPPRCIPGTKQPAVRTICRRSSRCR